MAFSFLSQELAIDLGTANTVIFQNDQIVLDEPSIVAIDNQTGKCIALGQKAKLMHEKTNRRIIDTIVPILSEVVEAGVKEGVFSCDHIAERMRIILIVSNGLFDDNSHFTKNDVTVFVDMIEKMLGAKKDTMGFVEELINS